MEACEHESHTCTVCLNILLDAALDREKHIRAALDRLLVEAKHANDIALRECGVAFIDSNAISVAEDIISKEPK